MQVKLGLLRRFRPAPHHVTIRWMDTNKEGKAEVLPREHRVTGYSHNNALYAASDMVQSLKRIYPGMHFDIRT